MCDYSLQHVASRPARVSDKLVTTKLSKSSTRAFAAVGEYGAKLVIHDGPPEVAVCLLPGTELAFDDNVRYGRGAFGLLGKARVNHKVARFRQIDLDDPHGQHDALEFPDGKVLKVAQLAIGQTATVLQLPVATHPEPVEAVRVARAEHIALNRGALRPGMSSMLMPSLETVMLWDAIRGTAIRLSTALAQSFRRLTAHQRHTVALPAGADAAEIEASLYNGVLAAPLPKKSAASEKKIDVKAAA